MASITVDQTALQAADTFLTAFLQDKVPDADFSQGSAMRDLTVKAIAYVFAYLEGERATARALTSLQGIATLDPATPDIDEAVDAILSNWFVKRKQGTQTRITARAHFSQPVDTNVLPTTRFFRDPSHLYLIDQTSQLTLFGTDMRPTVAADGTIEDYTVNISLIAQTAGSSYNFPPGRFSQVDVFSPYFLFAENIDEGRDGTDVETTTELQARAPNAITIRNLVNNRSITAVLQEEFPGLSKVVPVGYGDPEMTRDFSSEAVTGLQIHLGGYTDIYVSLPRTEVTESLTLGALFARPDNVINILRDPAGFAGASPGDVLNVTAGLPGTAFQYVVQRVSDTELEVHERVPFPVATDEAPTNITYSIGRFSPNFDSVIASRATGQTSRRIRGTGQVVLSGRPVYAVKSVEAIDSGGVVTALPTRVNGVPSGTEYQLSSRNPANAQSVKAVTTLTVDPALDGQTLRVTYETLANFADVDAFITDASQRTNNANQLAKALHPVYIGAEVKCQQAAGKPALVAADVAADLVAFINAFDFTTPFDVTSLTKEIRNNPSVASLTNFRLTYTLLGPDGQQYEFDTRDIVTLAPNYPANNARLVNPTEIALLQGDPSVFANTGLDPALGAGNLTLVTPANAILAQQLAALGVSDRTIRFFARLADVVVTVG